MQNDLLLLFVSKPGWVRGMFERFDEVAKAVDILRVQVLFPGVSRTPHPINNETQRHAGVPRCAATVPVVLVEVTRLRKDLPKSDATDFRKSIESQ